SAIGAALLGMVAVTAAPRGEARAAKEKPAAGRAAHAHGKRISAKGSAEPSRHPPRRGGSTPARLDKPQSGGGRGGGGPKSGKAHAKETGGGGVRAGNAAAGAKRHRVARVLSAAPKLPCLHDPIEFERGFGGDVQSVVLTRCDGRPAPHAVEQISVL